MKTRVVSIDLWRTVFDPYCEVSSSVARKKLVADYAACYGFTDKARLDEEYEKTTRLFYDTYKDGAVTLTPRERLASQLDRVKIPHDGEDFEELINAVELSILDNPPSLSPNLPEALERLSKHFDLAIVSDTGFSPGRVIRQLFEKYGIAKRFRDYSFSDENRVAKPDPIAFISVYDRLGVSPSECSECWHVGDLEWTDVKGAKAIGAHACLYTGINSSDDNSTQADFVLEDWAHVSQLIDLIQG